MNRDGARPSVETRRWTRREYGRMIDAGILHEDEPIELIEGRLIVAEPQNTPNVSFTSSAGEVSRGVTGSGVDPVPTFADVPVAQPFFIWIETLVDAGITGGCATSPRQYCPDSEVTRGQVAVFVLRGIHGGGYQPPEATGMFTDVPGTHPFAKWIEQLAREGITGGCATSPSRYCPDAAVTRGEIAVFLVRTFNLPI